MKSVFHFIASPRAAERFVNVYRFLRATLTEEEYDTFVSDEDGDYRVGQATTVRPSRSGSPRSVGERCSRTSRCSRASTRSSGRQRAFSVGHRSWPDTHSQLSRCRLGVGSSCQRATGQSAGSPDRRTARSSSRSASRSIPPRRPPRHAPGGFGSKSRTIPERTSATCTSPTTSGARHQTGAPCCRSERRIVAIIEMRQGVGKDADPPPAHDDSAPEGREPDISAAVTGRRCHAVRRVSSTPPPVGLRRSPAGRNDGASPSLAKVGRRSENVRDFPGVR